MVDTIGVGETYPPGRARVHRGRREDPRKLKGRWGHRQMEKVVPNLFVMNCNFRHIVIMRVITDVNHEATEFRVQGLGFWSQTQRD